MTSEVVIFNNQGIALAADSAVTIGSKKTYNSAIKLFSLSTTEPIGAMVFGNANLLSVPWELIIKSYRAQLLDKSYSNLCQYAEDLIEYVSACKFLSENSQNDWLKSSLETYFSHVLENIMELVHDHFRQKGEITTFATRKIVTSVVSEHLDELDERPFSGAFTRNDEPKIRKSIISIAKVAQKNIFENLPVTKLTQSKLYELAVRLVTREMFSRSDLTGLVIAGYGKSEIFPQVATYKIAGSYNDKLRYIRDEKRTYCNNDGISAILAFADYQMVDTFMSGTNNALLTYIYEYVLETLDSMPELISKVYGTKPLHSNDKYRQLLIEIMDECFESIQGHIRHTQSSPVMSMVAALPKDELAAMAESLVSLTAFKRKVSHTIESVGGPVDVAVISKGDGLVWVKRKHYFPSELNHNYFKNYGK